MSEKSELEELERDINDWRDNPLTKHSVLGLFDRAIALANMERVALADSRRVSEGLAEALRKAVHEFKNFPASLAYEFTHLPEMEAALALYDSTKGKP